MLSAFKHFLRLTLAPALYFGGIFVAFATILKKAEWGLLLMISMIPQPNIWYKLHEYPMGKDFMDIFFFAVLLGIIYQKKGFEKTSNTTLILIFISISYLALWNSSMRFSLPLPITRSNQLLPDFKNYAEMILLYFLVLNVAKEEDQQKLLAVIMSSVILFIAMRSYRNFSAGDAFNYDKRVGGPFEAVHLGANHFGAFIVHYCAVFLGLFLFDKEKKRKWLYLATILFGLHPLFFTYSRGVYLAALGVLSFFGLVKKKLLFLVLIIILTWQVILPPSVVDRVMMTKTAGGEVEHSAAGRVELWGIAWDFFKENPVFGIGYGGYALSVGGSTLLSGEIVPEGFDTHSYWMKILCEQGLIGGALFLFLVYMAFRSGLRLYKIAETDFYRGLGFGFMGCVIAVCITNMFGDRWSYFALGGYFWVFWGLVDRCILSSINNEKNLPLSEER